MTSSSGAPCLVLALAVCAFAGPAAQAAEPKPPEPPTFSPGARTLHDPLLAQIGNGGYDAIHYEIELGYDPAANRFDSASTTITARATKNLSQLSLDFQDLPAREVLVDGERARFEQVATKPFENPTATVPMKLVVTPPAGIRAGRELTVEVDYSGSRPQVFTDPDGSSEGWIPACRTPPGETRTCDSSFVVGEPMGSQAWFPSNNHPSDKATFDTTITVPGGDTAFGAGELSGAPTDNGDGTTTWAWSEDDPTATYLVTASNGDFDYSESKLRESATGRTLPLYTAIDPSASDAQQVTLARRLGRTEEITNFLAERYGPYPFDSNGALVDHAPSAGYALEVQGKAHYASPSASQSTIVHELAHGWFGNSVTPARWSDIWLGEGWAQWSQWLWDFSDGTAAESPAQRFTSGYASGPESKWEIAPAVLDGDPANLFSTFPTYTRGAMTLEGYRQIVGDARFDRFAKALQRDFAHANIGTRELIDFAKRSSGLRGGERMRLESYFQQWLYDEAKPEILPADFR